MRLILVGFNGKTGSATHFSEMASALERIQPFGRLVVKHDLSKQDPQVPIETKSGDVVMLFKPAVVDGRAYIIKWAIFETAFPPKKMIRWLDDSAQIWVPSEWGKKVLIDHGISATKVVVIHEGVNPSIYHRLGGVVRDDTPIKLLSVGAPHHRKGLDDVISSFLATKFSPAEASLTLKVDSFSSGGTGYYDPAELLRRFSNPPNVSLLTSALPDVAMSTLYRSHHAYVGGSRGEGWGLPIIEAAASGIPIVTPVHSALTEFLSKIKEHIYPVEYREELVDNASIYAKSWTEGQEDRRDQWYVVEEEDLTRQIKNCVADIKSGEAHVHAQTASNHVRRFFSWEIAAEEAWHHILRGPLSDLSLSL